MKLLLHSFTSRKIQRVQKIPIMSVEDQISKSLVVGFDVKTDFRAMFFSRFFSEGCQKNQVFQ